uniref:Photosynthesis system II assembly factor Ycf48/Hcf136-like domain-containing protein n=2 Tax=Litorilinea aerophila TaxID=1204385 RepID=A0A540VN64_9CHLR
MRGHHDIMTPNFSLLKEQAWQRQGGWAGGTVTALALSPAFPTDGLALAATPAGLFRTEDGGDSWHRAMDGILDAHMTAVAFAPLGGGRMAFVASEQGRLYRSEDGGATWREVSAWAGLGVVTALACSPHFPEDGTLFAATPAGVFRTLDGGASWESCTFGLLDLDVLCLACAPDFPESQVVWAGTAQGGFYRSRNAGRAWRDAGFGLPDTAIQCLLVTQPAQDAAPVLWVGTEGHGLYVSRDGGAHWEAAGQALAHHSVNCLAAVEGGSEGATLRLVAGTDGGVFFSEGSFSEDGGQHWEPADGGAFIALSLAAAQGEPVLLAGAYQEGIFRSRDGGKRWDAAGTGLEAHAPPLVRLGPGGSLWAHDLDGELAFSVDGGRTWRSLPAGEEGAAVQGMAVAVEGDEAILLVATAEGLYLGQAAGQPGAVPWQRLPVPVDPAQIHLPLIAPNLELLVGDQGGRLHRSTDGGQTWQALAVPWTGQGLLNLVLAPDFGHSRGCLAVTAARNRQGNYDVQIWQGTEGGQAWQELLGLETEVPAVAVAWPQDPAHQSRFFATRHRVIRLYRDAESGEMAVSQAFLQEGLQITRLLPSPAYQAARTVLAATSQGVFISTDDGTTWAPLGQGLPACPVVELLPVDTGLLAVTLGGGLWRLG